MSCYENPYSSPEKFGLEIVDTFDSSSGCYEFDYTVLWKHEDGTFYLASDSGCSCPSPFEDYGSLSDLDTVASLNDLADRLSADRAEYRVDMLRKASAAGLR